MFEISNYNVGGNHICQIFFFFFFLLQYKLDSLGNVET